MGEWGRTDGVSSRKLLCWACFIFATSLQHPFHTHFTTSQERSKMSLPIWSYPVTFALAYAFYSFFVASEPSPDEKAAKAALKDEERARKHAANTVTLFQFAYESKGPSGSPFCTKAETLLKMTETSYKSEFGTPSSMPKGKVPVYIYNGHLFEDSQMGFENLLAKGAIKTDLDAQLSPELVALGLAYRRLIENHLSNIVALERWRDSWPASRDQMFFKPAPGPLRIILGWFIQPKVIASLKGTGIARYTNKEIYDVMLPEDLQAISTQLGNKEWMLGTEKPTTLDASLFGSLATALYWADFNPNTAKEIM